MLRPMVFVIYINDVPEIIHLFADDTNIYRRVVKREERDGGSVSSGEMV